jgi:hypothetical protein
LNKDPQAVFDAELQVEWAVLLKHWQNLKTRIHTSALYGIIDPESFQTFDKFELFTALASSLAVYIQVGSESESMDPTRILAM